MKINLIIIKILYKNTNLKNKNINQLKNKNIAKKITFFYCQKFE